MIWYILNKIKMNNKLNELLQLLKKEKEKYNEKLQTSINFKELTLFKKRFKEFFNNDLENEYLQILEFTDGFDNDGVVLYASHRSLINGYKDRFIEGIIEANKIWYEEREKNNFIFYAESELYLFFKSIIDDNFYCVYRDDIKIVVFKTKDKKYFFKAIIKLSLGEPVE